MYDSDSWPPFVLTGRSRPERVALVGEEAADVPGRAEAEELERLDHGEARRVLHVQRVDVLAA